jgi:hypothetical protein
MFSALLCAATPPQQLSLIRMASRDTKSLQQRRVKLTGSCWLGARKVLGRTQRSRRGAAGPRVVPPVDSVLITRFDIFAFCWHATSEYETDARQDKGATSGPV